VDFRIAQQIDAPVTVVEERLLDPDVIAATADLRPLADCRLLDLDRRGDQVTVRIHRRFAAPLPAAVTAVIDPRRLTWVEEVVVDLARHTGAHRIVPDHYPKLLQCEFRTALHDLGGTTAREAAGWLRARVLLGAGPVERAIVSGLREYAEAEADLLGHWAPGGAA
jgi:hypothetical protein